MAVAEAEAKRFDAQNTAYGTSAEVFKAREYFSALEKGLQDPTAVTADQKDAIPRKIVIGVKDMDQHVRLNLEDPVSRDIEQIEFNKPHRPGERIHMRKHVLTVIVGVVVGVSLLLYMFAFQVRESEVAVLLRFGKASTDLPQPGYHFKLPWPIEEVRKFDSRINVSEGRFEETPTKDKRNITLSLCVGWRVSDPLAFNQNFGRLPEEDRMKRRGAASRDTCATAPWRSWASTT